ncbi:LCP family protein required for cell wall assembly [Streptosporangium becharense]|uniref:LCP family protein required for cell wall assembly n=1 Tax=Streptosporangium becharense TaxID=1816182 RepID=A0A7W9ILL0_9ACTN|nr:LCP family protein [Streptosporangium becharense]MBB2911577.1 LCP family protein required for cell wall assembly [Streptosporangium becharense]MBB5822605.1 LCP family protein required for cell wall assembly [Streptosporangium becharense]
MRDRSKPPGVGAVIGWTALSAIAPGAAHLRAGWRRSGLALLSGYAVLLLGLLWVVLTSDFAELAGQLVVSSWLTVITVASLALGAAWFAVVVHSFMVMNPGALPARWQALSGTLAGALAVSTLVPFGMVGQYAAVSQSTLDGVFNAPVTPQPGATGAGQAEQDPWAGRERVNILLLGGDADTHRVGVRTDSINVASIDVKTGNTVLLSLPRNLENVRFVPGSPMAERFPDGFRLPPNPDGSREDLLFAVWEYADAHPEIFGGRKNQGTKTLIDTIGYTLGLKIDWYALVNMWGFARLIDAIGGVTLTVPEDVIFGKYNEGVVKAGTRKLRGADAMWFARSRTNSDDFTRMGRQRCVLGALLSQADPATVLARFNRIALAAKELLRTDIPRPMLEHLVPLALKVKNAKVTSVQFVPPLINTGYPDWKKIRTVTAKAIRASTVTRQPLTATTGPTATPTAVAAAAPTASPAATATRTPRPDPAATASAKPADPATPKGITEGCG